MQGVNKSRKKIMDVKSSFHNFVSEIVSKKLFCDCKVYLCVRKELGGKLNRDINTHALGS